MSRPMSRMRLSSREAGNVLKPRRRIAITIARCRCCCWCWHRRVESAAGLAHCRVLGGSSSILEHLSAKHFDIAPFSVSKQVPLLIILETLLASVNVPLNVYFFSPCDNGIWRKLSVDVSAESSRPEPFWSYLPSWSAPFSTCAVVRLGWRLPCSISTQREH